MKINLKKVNLKKQKINNFMLLLVGLGNEGKEFENTRHNVGFQFIDYLKNFYNLTNTKNKLKSHIFRGKILNQNVILSKPITMMNCSGEAIRLIKNYYKIEINNIFVFHDELDLELERVKIKLGGGSAGHNGIKSIDKNIGNNYFRIRVGIKNSEHYENASSYVLSKFNKLEAKKIIAIIAKINKNLNYVFQKDIDNFMQSM
mgnify:CR=1 FL=1